MTNNKFVTEQEYKQALEIISRANTCGQISNVFTSLDVTELSKSFVPYETLIKIQSERVENLKVRFFNESEKLEELVKLNHKS